MDPVGGKQVRRFSLRIVGPGRRTRNGVFVPFRIRGVSPESSCVPGEAFGLDVFLSPEVYGDADGRVLGDGLVRWWNTPFYFIPLVVRNI